MKVPADKSPEPQRQTAAHEAPQQQDRSDAELKFVDNRPETISLRQLQEAADNSPRRQGLAQLKAMMNNSPRGDAMRSLQAKVDNSPRRASMRLQAGRNDVTVQRVEDEAVLQGEFAADPPAQLAQPSDDKPNNTGLPDNLKAGVESLSGISMDNVKVHYNSSEPAQLNAHAYAQGTDIHLGPGQEQHLPHEAWHVVQQAQGRVKPTVQMKENVNVNDDAQLENEADVMGAKAFQMKPETGSSISMDAGVTQKKSRENQFALQDLGVTSNGASLQMHSMDVVQLSTYKTDLSKSNHEIYMIYSQDGGAEPVQYIGRTNQGIATRFGQHKASKKWVTDRNCAVYKLSGGTWTLFEVATHEQYWIIKGGGKAILENTIDGITYAKYSLYKTPTGSAWNANQNIDLASCSEW